MSNFAALIVEDDPFQRESLADLLKSEGLEVVECANAAAAELVLASTGPDLRALVTDAELGGETSGAELAQYAKRKFPDLNVVLVSGHGPPLVPKVACLTASASSGSAIRRPNGAGRLDSIRNSVGAPVQGAELRQCKNPEYCFNRAWTSRSTRVAGNGIFGCRERAPKDATKMRERP